MKDLSDPTTPSVSVFHIAVKKKEKKEGGHKGADEDGALRLTKVKDV